MRSDTQLCILVAASQEENGRAYPFPGHLVGDCNREAALLVKAKLLDYARPTILYPAWREVRGKGPQSLVITEAGLREINA